MCRCLANNVKYWEKEMNFYVAAFSLSFLPSCNLSAFFRLVLIELANGEKGGEGVAVHLGHESLWLIALIAASVCWETGSE